MTDRLATPTPLADEQPDPALRPRSLAAMIGQDKLRANMQILVEAAKHRSEPLDHVLFYGPPGLGKTTLALALANEMSAAIKVTSGPAIERAGDLAALLAGLQPGDVLFIDEIHRLNRTVEEILYPAMEDFQLQLVVGTGTDTKTIVVRLPKFTVIGATTRLALLSAPLRARFGVTERFDFYSVAALEQIVARAAPLLDTQLTAEGAHAIAVRSRGTPRVALRLLRRLRDFAQVRATGVITPTVAEQALQLLGVDALGLDDLDHRALDALLVKFAGRPVGLATIAAAISEEPETLQDVVEPYLLQIGFLERTPRGRLATTAASDHMAHLQRMAEDMGRQMAVVTQTEEPPHIHGD